MSSYSDQDRYDDPTATRHSDDNDSRRPSSRHSSRRTSRRDSSSDSDSSTDSEDKALEQELYDIENPRPSRTNVMHALGKRESQRYSRLDSTSASRSNSARSRHGSDRRESRLDSTYERSIGHLPFASLTGRSSTIRQSQSKNVSAPQQKPRRTALWISLGAAAVLIIGLIVIVTVIVNNHKAGEQVSMGVGDALNGHTGGADQGGSQHPSLAIATPTAAAGEDEEDGFDWKWNPVDWFRDDDEKKVSDAHPSTQSDHDQYYQKTSEWPAIGHDMTATVQTQTTDSPTPTAIGAFGLPVQDIGHSQTSATTNGASSSSLTTTSTSPIAQPTNAQAQPNSGLDYSSSTFRMSSSLEPFQTYKGKAAVYSAYGHLSPCGAVTKDQDFVVAVPLPVFLGATDHAQGASRSYTSCNATVLVTSMKTGATVQAWVTGACSKCDANSIELSRTAFKALTLSAGDLHDSSDIDLADADEDALEVVWGLGSGDFKDMQQVKSKPESEEDKHFWSE
ncbi:hypothetical protein ACM66B_004229 [Microbotryomycetes sp. NB124-2]